MLLFSHSSFEMVVVFRPTSRPSSAAVSPILPSPLPPIALLSFSEKVGVLILPKLQDAECSITIPTTTWLAPGYSICTVLQTVLPCGSVVTASACPEEIEVTTFLSQSPSPAPIANSIVNDQQNEGPPAVPGDYSQGKLNGIIIGTVFAVIVVVVAVFLWGNKRLINGKFLRRPGDDEVIEFEGPPRRPDGGGGDAGGGAAPGAPAPAEPEAPPAPEPAPETAPEPAPEPAPEAVPEPPAAPPPAALDLALLPPAALGGDAAHAHAPATPHTSPEPQPDNEARSDDDEYVYPRRRRRRRSSSESRVRFAEEAEIIPDQRPWRDV